MADPSQELFTALRVQDTARVRSILVASPELVNAIDEEVCAKSS